MSILGPPLFIIPIKLLREGQKRNVAFAPIHPTPAPSIKRSCQLVSPAGDAAADTLLLSGVGIRQAESKGFTFVPDC